MAEEDPVDLLCKEIQRISDGGTTVTFEALATDEQVVQTFEALFGTLKAARKQGVLTFQGELLLLGQHDQVEITLTGAADADSASPAPEPAPAAPGPSEEPAVPAAATAAEEKVPEEPKPAVLKPATELAAEPVAEVAAEPASEPAAEPPQTDAAPSQSEGTTEPQGAPDGAASDATPDGGKKWSVDTSYIDWRTADPNRLEGRRAGGETQAPGPDGVGSAVAKDQDGKWQQVDVSYINHRTADCDNLQGRKNTATGAAEAASATTRKESDGKWKVDTSYIGYRTGDPDNIRKDDRRPETNYANPEETNYPYAELQGVANRPSDVDPTCKERYLSDEEFHEKFKMSHEEFTKLPKWKQQNLKKNLELY